MCGWGQRRFFNKTLFYQHRVIQRGLYNKEWVLRHDFGSMMAVQVMYKGEPLPQL